MTDKHFATGEIVKLRSGGPRMTVKEVFAPDVDDILRRKGSYEYRCQWFAGSKLQDGIFIEEGLELCSDDAGKAK
jgi:uncharacterized protein YodC (DUF2158 family)